MKKTITILAVISSLSFVNAQEIKKKKIYFNTGIGLTDSRDFNWSKNFYIGAEYKFTDTESMAVSFENSELNYLTFSNEKYYSEKFTGLQFQFNHDWSKLLGINHEKIDIYTGVNFGVGRIIKSDYQYSNGNVLLGHRDTYISFGSQIGARYFIAKNLGINTEINYSRGFTQIKTGLSYKF
jgi:hypothetical protein